MKRRERTRHLIELGGLVVKAGLVELTGDDRAVLLGAFLEIADTCQAGTASKLSRYGGEEEVERFRDSTQGLDG